MVQIGHKPLLVNLPISVPQFVYHPDEVDEPYEYVGCDKIHNNRHQNTHDIPPKSLVPIVTYKSLFSKNFYIPKTLHLLHKKRFPKIPHSQTRSYLIEYKSFIKNHVYRLYITMR